jgi:hypothetical protein
VLTLLTPTGTRPEAWALCERWMARQTYTGPVRWIVVDDGIEPQPVTFARHGWELIVIRPAQKWRVGDNSQARNLLEGLTLIRPDERVAICEDDDWYAPGWLERIDRELDSFDLVGQGWNRYYHVRTGAIREHDNDKHASLCASAFKGKALQVFRTQCERAPRLIDAVMWKHSPRRHVFKARLVVGMKGLPGRAGIAGGHKDLTGEPFDLREWIGDDALAYAQFR